MEFVLANLYDKREIVKIIEKTKPFHLEEGLTRAIMKLHLYFILKKKDLNPSNTS